MTAAVRVTGPFLADVPWAGGASRTPAVELGTQLCCDLMTMLAVGRQSLAKLVEKLFGNPCVMAAESKATHNLLLPDKVLLALQHMVLGQRQVFAGVSHKRTL